MAKASPDLTNFDLYKYFYALVRQIPAGMVSTYGSLARALGDVVASRACGYMLSINPDPVGTPCYKVVRSDGTIGKFTHPDGSAEKVKRLNNDGVQTGQDKITDFDRRNFNGFVSDYPLQTMKEEQERMAPRVNLKDNFSTGRLAAVDVSYDDFQGYGTMVIEEEGSIEVRKTIMPVNFPYIPGYLSYREFKFIRQLAFDFDGLLLVDANGYLHPRHIGLASFTGIKLGIPTIGVAKSLLTGRKKGQWIYMEEEKSAFEINRKTIVSAGNRISLQSSVDFIEEKYGGKYPDLLKLAHEESVKLRIQSRKEEYKIPQ